MEEEAARRSCRKKQVSLQMCKNLYEKVPLLLNGAEVGVSKFHPDYSGLTSSACLPVLFSQVFSLVGV